MLQTPILACSLGYFDNPDLFTRLSPKLRYIPYFLGSGAVALVYAGPTSPPPRFFFQEILAHPQFPRQGAVALVHVGPATSQQQSFAELEVHLQFSRRSTVGLVHAGPASPPRLFLSRIEVHPQLSQRSTCSRARRNSASWRAPPWLAARARRPSCTPHQRGRHLADSRPEGRQLRSNFLLRSCHWRLHASIVIPMPEEAPTSAVPWADSPLFCGSMRGR